MNREIKFRGQRKDNKEWVFGIPLVKGERTAILRLFQPPLTKEKAEEFITGFRCFDVIPETVGQFTGLLDKNGKEIYEGDRVRYKYRGNWVEGVVKYHKASFCIRQSQEIYTGMDYLTVEVIGNIHDIKENS